MIHYSECIVLMKTMNSELELKYNIPSEVNIILNVQNIFF